MGVMTISYGATPYGMGQQLIEDTRDMSEYLRDKEHLHAAMLGNLLHTTCHKMLPGPAGMLTLFENLADKANKRDQYLKWNTPITNFPVVQGYRKPTSLRTKLKYGDEELKVNIENWQETTVNKEAQKLGASPNIVHSFDAAHLTMTVHSADYEVTVVHDSFGTLPGNMADMFSLVREQFVRFYQNDPLENLLSQTDSIELLPVRGKLEIEEVLYSDYAFC
jgi:DNA-directed RNA polymerase